MLATKPAAGQVTPYFRSLTSTSQHSPLEETKAELYRWADYRLKKLNFANGAPTSISLIEALQKHRYEGVEGDITQWGNQIAQRHGYRAEIKSDVLTFTKIDEHRCDHFVSS